MMKIVRTLFSCLFAILLQVEGHACTMVLVSGSATVDGRPLMFKNRDSSSGYLVEMEIVRDEGFAYLAQFHKSDGERFGPWGGFNEKGFTIANTLTYNVTAASFNENNVVMDRALTTCETVDDFKSLLDLMMANKPLEVKANYGVMDALGNLAFFEVWANGYAIYDANDPEVAPDGILVRTNYSFSGTSNNRVGEDRYAIASNYMQSFSGEQVDWHDLLQGLPRLLVNKNGTNLCNRAPLSIENETPVTLDGYIPRNITTSAMLIQGVKDGESPLLTVCWSMTGPPLATVAVPCFLTSDDELPAKIVAADNDKSWLCDKGRVLKEFIYTYPQNSKMIDLSKIYNQEETGIMQRIWGLEEEVINRGDSLIEEARLAGELTPSAWHAYCEWLDPYLEDAYDQAFVDLWKAGDVNQDNHVDVVDVSYLVNIILSVSKTTSTADVNGDELVNVTDISKLVNIILGF